MSLLHPTFWEKVHYLWLEFYYCVLKGGRK